jgi:SAM-dependent methyltransferase
MTGPVPTLQCPCDRANMDVAFTYDAPPEGETRFTFKGTYKRAYDRCTICGHWFSRHDIDIEDIYGGGYVDATYGERALQVYNRIMALPPNRSDNIGRVARVCAFASTHWAGSHNGRRLLDVGSGLAVFPARMKEAGWICTALDPDPRMSEHARAVVGVGAVTGDFMAVKPEDTGLFDVVTLNKVLEHVEDPVVMLAQCSDFLADDGFVYVELPDGEAASEHGSGREEFFIEHHHVFSAASFAHLTERAGFRLTSLERLCEPSGKFTLRGFLLPS